MVSKALDTDRRLFFSLPFLYFCFRISLQRLPLALGIVPDPLALVCLEQPGCKCPIHYLNGIVRQPALNNAQVENAEVRKLRYGNISMEVRRKAAHWCLVSY